jgi:hypothetical protein
VRSAGSRWPAIAAGLVNRSASARLGHSSVTAYHGSTSRPSRSGASSGANFREVYTSWMRSKEVVRKRWPPLPILRGFWLSRLSIHQVGSRNAFLFQIMALSGSKTGSRSATPIGFARGVKRDANRGIGTGSRPHSGGTGPG